MPIRDYYDTLGVSPQASDEDIKKAYRRLVFQYHPDRNPGNTEAEEKIREINAAYEVIGDPETRRTYERIRFGDEIKEEAPDPDILVEQMVAKLYNEGRKELFAVLIKDTARIKTELALIRTRTVEQQGYDSFKEAIVGERGAEVLKEFLTPEMIQKKARLVDVAVQMMVGQRVVGRNDEPGMKRLRGRFDESYHKGMIGGFMSALELFYARR